MKITLIVLVFPLLFIDCCIGEYGADQFLKEKITKLTSKLKKEENEWEKERHELIQANQELKQQNEQLWGENFEKDWDVEMKDIENNNLESQIQTWILGLIGMFTVIIIINIAAYFIFGYKCFRHINCKKKSQIKHDYLPLTTDDLQSAVPL